MQLSNLYITRFANQVNVIMAERMSLILEALSESGGNLNEQAFSDDLIKDTPTLDNIFSDLQNVENGDDANSGKGDKEVGSACEAKNLYEGSQRCQYCINWVEEYPDDFDDNIEARRECKRCALLVRYGKHHGDDKGLKIHSVIIQSSRLKSILGDVFSEFEGITTNLQKLVFTSPPHSMPFSTDGIGFSGRQRTKKMLRQKSTSSFLSNILVQKLMGSSLYGRTFLITESLHLSSCGLCLSRALFSMES